MNANYIYDIFETTGKHNAPDLNVGLAMLKADKPIPEGMTYQGVREFMGRHYEALVEGYKARDREAFATVVAKCEAEDAEREAMEV